MDVEVAVLCWLKGDRLVQGWFCGCVVWWGSSCDAWLTIGLPAFGTNATLPNLCLFSSKLYFILSIVVGVK